ncbi:hypothetical protein [Paenibacillus hemerocallicola]|nr:hypothetical protein [Paenibacillus hemerocallicola]
MAQPERKSMYAAKSGTSCKVKFRYGTGNNMVLEFNELGINRIIHPKKIYKEPAERLTPDFAAPVLWNEIKTDWVSPYRGITALQGSTSSFTGTVGGNHGTVRGEGVATARGISAVMYADGAMMNDQDAIHCAEVKLVVTNYISASNKINVHTGEKADSLKEVVTYTVTPNHIEVSVHLTALEDLTINGYIGLQMTTNLFAGQVYFSDSEEKYTPNGVMHSSRTLPYRGDRFVYADSGNVIAVYTNRASGLGDLSHKGTGPIHFVSSSNKIYSHLIDGPITLMEDDSVHYSGGYTLDVPMECDGAEKAYTIKVNGVNYYCVDFLQPVSAATLQLDPGLLGKQIEIVEKSDNISCDDTIGEKGLSMAAAGFGSLKFKLKG